MMNWNQLLSIKRFGLEERHNTEHTNRTEFQRDFDRLIFSNPFRRLQNKTQVFPLPGSVFVHNRLTHSLEVSCVGRSIGETVSQLLTRKHKQLASETPLIHELGSIVSAACLTHDLGNPPFGHSGESAISTYFSEGNGKEFKDQLKPEFWTDIIHFEGNANTFRLLTHQFNGRRNGGFALTYSTLAAIVKYPFESSVAGGKPKFGFFQSEKEYFERVADELQLIKKNNSKGIIYARYPLVYLVEAADDICYQLMDIEDAHKLRILTTEEVNTLLNLFLSDKQKIRAKEVFNVVTDTNERIAYLRTVIIGILVQEISELFVAHEESILKGDFEKDLISHLPNKTREAYTECKKTAYSKIYRSKEVTDIELAGYKIIRSLLEYYLEAILTPDKTYSKLILEKVPNQYDIHNKSIDIKVQAILDFISGMTDIYALDLYRKINGHSLPAI